MINLKDYEITYHSFNYKNNRSEFNEDIKKKCTKDAYLVDFFLYKHGHVCCNYGRILSIENDIQYDCERIDTTKDLVFLYSRTNTHYPSCQHPNVCCVPNNMQLNEMVGVSHYYICKKEELHDLIAEFDKIRDNYLHEKEVNEFENTFCYLLNHGYNESVLELVKKAPDWFDMNYMLDKQPIFFSIVRNKGGFKTLEYFINHPSFNVHVKDAFGENIITALFFEAKNFAENWSGGIKHLTELVFKNKDFDRNQVNANHDNILSSALTFLGDLRKISVVSYNEYIRYLTYEVKLDVNNVNDWNETPLSIAIKNGDLTSVNTLLGRDDLIIRQEDIELAKEMKNGLLSLLAGKEVTQSCDVEKINFYNALKKLWQDKQENEAIKLSI